MTYSITNMMNGQIKYFIRSARVNIEEALESIISSMPFGVLRKMVIFIGTVIIMKKLSYTSYKRIPTKKMNMVSNESFNEIRKYLLSILIRRMMEIGEST